MKSLDYRPAWLLALALIPAAPLGAQQDSASSAAAQEAVQLAPVQVTATLRTEPLQAVPVSVSVVDGADLDRRGLDSLFQVASEVPELTFRDNESYKDTSLLIRGIGTVTTTLGADPSVSTVVDGVVLARSGQAATLDLVDVEQLEVLRGPQSTLFGKNASAGVVSVTTRDPAPATSGYVDVGFFGGDEFKFRAGVSAVVAPGAASLAVNVLYGYYEGNVTNLADGSTVNGYQKAGARGKLVVTPTTDLKLTFIADLLHTYNDTPFVPVVAGSYTATAPLVFSFAPSPTYLAAASPLVPSANNTDINTPYKTYDEDLNYGFSATAELKLEPFTLTAISAYREWYNDQYQDGERAPLPTAAIPQEHDRGHVHLYQLSEELRLASAQNGLIDYVTGLYLDYVHDAETYQRNDFQIVGGDDVYNQGRSVYGTSDLNYSAFGEATINLTSAFRAIAGVRLIHDEIQFDETRVSTSAATIPGIKPSTQGSGDSDANGYAARAGLQFDVDKNVTAYATYSRGYKGPAYDVFFNYASATDSAPVVAETSNSYEVGVKSSVLANRLVANVDAFYTDYDNYQTNYYQLVDGFFVNHLVNAGTVNTRGVEADLTAHPTKPLTLRASAAAIRARVVDFTLPAGTPAADGINGGRLPFAPDFKTSLAADYRVPLGGPFGLDLGTDFTYQSRQLYDIGQSPGLSQGAYGIWNALIALSSSSQHWRVALIGRNLGDKQYYEFLSAGTGNIGAAIPRDDHTYLGVDFRLSF